ncbi:hypothetical protein ACFZCG_10960 [Streptomyces tanashiensis]|uniref:hypothetical protein n=1 Tax=Streptomyces tanashiensis TaxID=67367 RepID=UPI0036E57C2E
MPSELASNVLVELEWRGWPEGEKHQGDAELDAEVDALVAAARSMLKSEDDVTPAVPAQRRRWWRRAAA